VDGLERHGMEWVEKKRKGRDRRRKMKGIRDVEN
jgi:hypothetical protein